MLEWTSIRLMQLAQYYWPLTADGTPKFRAVEAKDRSGQPILDKHGELRRMADELATSVHVER